MAVVQISRIQIRRGRKNTGTGFPQLASGELGWAIDTQELYIGNGSVSEGSPYVGNTKLLSEHDDLFELADDYIYKEGTFVQTGDTANAPVQRTLQQRLDDIVSIRSFGANGDGTDQTVAVQRAIDQLFLNSNKGNARSRVVLYIEPGSYTISSTLYIPPYANIVGAGPGKTVFNFTGSGPALKTVNGDSTIGSYSYGSSTTVSNQTQKVRIEGITLSTGAIDTAMLLESCKDSIFKDLVLTGNFENGDIVDSAENIAIEITIGGTNGEAVSNDNYFENVTISDFSYGVVSEYDITGNIWTGCRFYHLGHGIRFGENTNLGVSGQFIGPSNNNVINCVFDDIEQHGFSVANGETNISSNNRYLSVGNDGGADNSNPRYSVIRFDTVGNESTNDYFSRTSAQSYDQTAFGLNLPYVPEVEGNAIISSSYTNNVSLSEASFDPVLIYRLPADGVKAFEIDYLYVSNVKDAMRQGKIEIVANPVTNKIQLVDDTTYNGNSTWLESLEFSVQFSDRNIDGTLDTIEVYVLNSTTADDADLYWKINTKTHVA
jgi:hypothetical protein